MYQTVLNDDAPARDRGELTLAALELQMTSSRDAAQRRARRMPACLVASLGSAAALVAVYDVALLAAR